MQRLYPDYVSFLCSGTIATTQIILINNLKSYNKLIFNFLWVLYGLT
jgi:hypothetical protein